VTEDEDLGLAVLLVTRRSQSEDTAERQCRGERTVSAHPTEPQFGDESLYWHPLGSRVEQGGRALPGPARRCRFGDDPPRSTGLGD
jgi:hypothetical protein